MTTERLTTADLVLFLNLAHVLRLAVNRRALLATGLTVDQGTVLCVIDLLGAKASISRIAETIRRAPHSTTSRVNLLERQGLVRRARVPGGDRRMVHVRLTPEGKTKLTAFRLAAERVIVDDPGDPPDIPNLRALQRLIETTKQILPDGDR